MKLNPDCMRDVLIEMEKAEYEEPLYLQRFYDALPKYSEDVINYSIVKLEEAGFIKATVKSRIGYDYSILRIDDITYSGHQFLADIRSESIWNNVKEVSAKVGSNSLQAISQIATSIITTIIKQQLGLPS